MDVKKGKKQLTEEDLDYIIWTFATRTLEYPKSILADSGAPKEAKFVAGNVFLNIINLVTGSSMAMNMDGTIVDPTPEVKEILKKKHKSLSALFNKIQDTLI
jgi:hypothetical protein